MSRSLRWRTLPGSTLLHTHSTGIVVVLVVVMFKNRPLAIPSQNRDRSGPREKARRGQNGATVDSRRWPVIVMQVRLPNARSVKPAGGELRCALQGVSQVGYFVTLPMSVVPPEGWREEGRGPAAFRPDSQGTHGTHVHHACHRRPWPCSNKRADAGVVTGGVNMATDASTYYYAY